MTNFLITGGAGFIGSHFVIKVADLGHNAVVLDKLTYAANPDNIAAVKHKLIEGDIADFSLVSKILHQEKIDFIVNFAAESHVDNSIKAPENFIQTNIIGTYNLLNCALTHFQNSSNEKKSQFRCLNFENA